MNAIAAPGSDLTHQSGTHTLLGLPDWAFYTFGAIFIAIGILLWFSYPKAKRNADKYRREQLVEYNKLHKSNTTDYSKTGMFLPAWEKTKMFAPVLIGTVLIIIGIGWLSMNSLGFL